jgi:hypothetical protein
MFSRHVAALVATAAVALLVALLAMLVVAPAASAAFNSVRIAALSAGSATLTAPTGVTASVNCSLSPTLTVHWSAPAGAPATGYAVFESRNGAAATPVTTVSGTTTSATFSILIWTTYTVSVQTKHNGWTSVLSGPSNSVLCLI